ncbi:MAG: 2-oxo acid dehydrogenase subunit E2 [Polyangiaceae bacterium]|nr:2-oxo acid dehydrogenase subunit E2 [Polyangiaceae bacterium]
MPRWEFKLPDIGEGVTEGEIVAWLVRPGDAVREDQPVVELMTDKATVTITAPRAGVIVEVRGRPGEIVPVHTVLAVFELDAPAARTPASAPPPAAPASPPAPAAAPPRTNGAAHVSAPPPEAEYFNDRPLATPATRKLARDMNIDLRQVAPSGPQGRVTKRDVEAHVDVGEPPPVQTPPGETDARSPGPTVRVPADREGAPLEERIPLAGLRRRIAQKMALSKTTAAHFTFVEECDATELKATRARLAGPAQELGAKLTLLPFVVKAVVAALRRHPILNSTLDDANQEIVLRRTYNIGVATATEAGLVVPVVKDADRKSLVEVAREIERLAEGARAGKSKIEDLQGSTFTITSLGASGGLLATPIINYPEVAILGVHRIKERPVVRAGQIVVGEVMLLSLSFDHRVVDGHVGAAFAYDVIGYLEHPDRLLLEMA